MEPTDKLTDDLSFDDLTEQYDKVISNMDKLQERYDTFYHYKKEISEDLNRLSRDMNKLTESVLESQRMGMAQAELMENAKIESTRFLQELLEEDYVTDMLKFNEEDFLEIPHEEDANMLDGKEKIKICNISFIF